METPQQPVQQNLSQDYFLNNQTKFEKKNGFFVWLKKNWQGFQYYARQVWPYLSRLISFLTYETIKAIKGIVKIALQQVGLFKN